MSASLVGSEMCIRDSCQAQEAKRFARRLLRLYLRKGGLRLSSIRSRRERAVSYTHLTLPTICSV
eukprot:13889059-Alexandrium_andersonii.AAC.1